MSAVADETRPGMVIEEFTSRRKGTLRGFARVALPGGMVLYDVSLHVTDGRPWAAPSSRPMLDREGNVSRDAEGKVRYAATMGFISKKARDRFSDAVVEAVRAVDPEAFL